MSEEKLEMNELEVTQAVDLMKHTIGLNGKYEKKLQFIPWRNYFDGQNDILDKLADFGYMHRDVSSLSGDVCYSGQCPRVSMAAGFCKRSNSSSCSANQKKCMKVNHGKEI